MQQYITTHTAFRASLYLQSAALLKDNRGACYHLRQKDRILKSSAKEINRRKLLSPNYDFFGLKHIYIYIYIYNFCLQ